MALEGGWGRLGLRPLEALLPHEETIAAQVAAVARSLDKDGMQKDPLVIDGDSGVVLDGMHRLAALGSLGAGYAVCGVVDYSSPGISLRRWARVYSTTSQAALSGALGEAGLTAACSTAEAFDSLEKKDQAVAALTDRDCYLPGRKVGLAEGLEVVRKLDRASAARGWKRRFVPEDEIDAPLQDRGALVVLLQRLGKSDVIGAARTGRLFPCKTSMHVIDPRPVGVDVPLKELKEGSTRTLDLRLKSHHTLLPPGSAYGGRRYKERLVLMKEH